MKLVDFLDRNAGKLLLVGVVTFEVLFAPGIVQVVLPDLRRELTSAHSHWQIRS